MHPRLTCLRHMVALFVFLSIAPASAAFARTTGDSTRPEIGEILFVGNQVLDDETLLNVVQSRVTPGAFGKFFYAIFGEKIGAKPEYYDRALFLEDAERLKRYYNTQGFYLAKIAEEARIDSAGRRASLRFIIDEGRRSHIDFITYVGLDSVPPDLKALLFEKSLLKVHRPYEKAVADGEIARTLDFLANNGYPAVRFDAEHSSANHYASTNNFRLVLAFDTGRRFHFGEISVRVEPPRDDIRDRMIVRHLDFRPGDLYSREKKRSSELNLNRLDIVDAARIENPRLPDSGSAQTVPVEILVHPRDRHEISPELSVSDESNMFNIGLGAAYTNRNFLGDARSFNVRTRVRTQSLGEFFSGRNFRDSAVTGAIEFQLQIVQPYLFTRTLSGTWTSSVIAEKRQLLINAILRNTIGLSNRFAAHTYGSLEWTLERSNPEILQSAGGGTVDSNTIISKLRSEEQPQFNSILTLSLARDKTNDIFSPTAGFFHSITLEESGLLPVVLSGIRGDLPFTQYYKATLVGRWYRDLTNTRYNIFAMKLKAGFQEKYGQSRNTDIAIPPNRRFYGGGSGSVRGWAARRLGAMPNSLLEFGGNFIFEGSLEMRINYFRGMGKIGSLPLDNIWGVYFLDFGNVWSGIDEFRARDIAIAAGIGFRYETFFGPFRIDYGFRVYDPKEERGKRTIFQKPFFSRTFGMGEWQFGIGHAF